MARRCGHKPRGEARMQTRKLNARIKFQRRSTVIDAFGNEEGGWVDLGVERFGELKPTRGGEDVQASRLTGKAMFDFWVRSDAGTRSVGTGDLAVDVRTGRAFNVRFNEDMTGQNGWRLMALESGVAGG